MMSEDDFIRILDLISQGGDDFDDYDELGYDAMTVRDYNEWDIINEDAEFYEDTEGLQGPYSDDDLAKQYDEWQDTLIDSMDFDPNESARILTKTLFSGGLPATSDEGQLRMFDSRKPKSANKLYEATVIDSDIQRLRKLAGI